MGHKHEPHKINLTHIKIFQNKYHSNKKLPYTCYISLGSFREYFHSHQGGRLTSTPPCSSWVYRFFPLDLIYYFIRSKAKPSKFKREMPVYLCRSFTVFCKSLGVRCYVVCNIFAVRCRFVWHSLPRRLPFFLFVCRPLPLSFLFVAAHYINEREP